MAQTRMIRTKIRATEEEARRLHEIAERQNIYIAKLIRECTLAPSMKRLVEIKISDVNDFSSSVSALEICMGNAFHLLQGSSSMFSGDMVIMKSMLKEVDENYVKLRKRVLEKRKVYGAFAAVCLSRLKLERAVEQQTEMSKNRYGISVSVTEDEINIIRKKAKEKGCSISTLLKQNVFIMYQNGMFTVNCDDLTELNNRLNRMIDFIGTIVAKMKGQYIEDEDVSNLEKITKSILMELAVKIDSINIEPNLIREEVRNRVLLKWRWL